MKIGNRPTAMDASVRYVQVLPETDYAHPDRQAVHGEQSAPSEGTTEIPTAFSSAKNDARAVSC